MTICTMQMLKQMDADRQRRTVLSNAMRCSAICLAGYGNTQASPTRPKARETLCHTQTSVAATVLVALCSEF